jgi:hypothetical protein
VSNWRAVLGNAFEAARYGGDRGASGAAEAKPWRSNGKLGEQSGTTAILPVVPVEPSSLPAFAGTIVTSPAPNRGDDPIPTIPLVVQAYALTGTPRTTGTTSVNLARRGAVVRLRSMSCPETFSAETWNQILADVERFLGKWGEQSLLLDWSDNDLFGVFPDAPATRYDAMGLTLLIRGGEVIELLQQCARLKTPRRLDAELS